MKTITIPTTMGLGRTTKLTLNGVEKEFIVGFPIIVTDAWAAQITNMIDSYAKLTASTYVDPIIKKYVDDKVLNTESINDLAVTTAKIAESAITGTKIKDGEIAEVDTTFLINKYPNLFNSETAVLGKYGTTDIFTSDYIAVTAAAYKTNMTNKNLTIDTYNADKEWISTIAAGKSIGVKTGWTNDVEGCVFVTLQVNILDCAVDAFAFKLGSTYNEDEYTFDTNLTSQINTITAGKEDITNKVTALSEESLDTEYPSAKCVYDLIGDVDTAISQINTIIGGA